MNKVIALTILGLFFSFNSIAQGVPADSLFTAYRQDTANNCASIAIIKANLNAFGLNGIYHEKKINDSTFEYLLKDSSKVFITQNELELARIQFKADTSTAKSDYSKSIVRTSLICYAIMAKMFPKAFPGLARTTYEANLDYISDTSFNVKLGTDLLGTGNYFVFLRRWADIDGKRGAIVWSAHHTVFASGRKCDMPGKSSEFYKWTKSYIRFSGRMYIDTTETNSKPWLAR